MKVITAWLVLVISLCFSGLCGSACGEEGSSIFSTEEKDKNDVILLLPVEGFPDDGGDEEKTAEPAPDGSYSPEADPSEREEESDTVPKNTVSTTFGYVVEDEDDVFYEVLPNIFARKDESVKMIVDNVSYSNPDATSSDMFVITSQYADDYEPFIVENLWDAQLGIPYKGASYSTEDAAKESSGYRTLGVPYSIKTKVQQEAIDRGY